jgi:hypothetical protein
MMIDLVAASTPTSSSFSSDTHIPSILLIWSVKSLADAYLLPDLLKLAGLSVSMSLLNDHKFKIVIAVTGGDDEETPDNSSDNFLLCEFSNVFESIIRPPSSSEEHGGMDGDVSHSPLACVIEYTRVTSSMIQKHLESFATVPRGGACSLCSDEDLYQFSTSSDKKDVATTTTTTTASASATVAFVCGPPSLTDNVIAMLIKDCALSPEDVLTERW